MLVLNPDTGRHDAQATPSTGSQSLFDFYACLLGGNATACAAERGDQTVF